MELPERVERYVERWFQRSGQTDWPTVRRVARALRVRQVEVEEAVDGHPAGNLMLTGYNIEDIGLADLFVENINPPAGSSERGE